MCVTHMKSESNRHFLIAMRSVFSRVAGTYIRRREINSCLKDESKKYHKLEEMSLVDISHFVNYPDEKWSNIFLQG